MQEAMSLRSHLFYGLVGLTFACLLACDANDRQRCDPIKNTGCESGLTCTLTHAGTPTCLAVSADAAGEGTRCRAPDGPDDAESMALPECGRGLACVAEQGISRCLRFCNPEQTIVDDDCAIDQPTMVQVEDGATSLNYAAYSTCRLSPIDRPEIGLCGLPCRLGLFADAAGCPDGTRCGLPVSAATATCMLNGTRRIGQSCGTVCPCVEPNVCVLDQRGAACRVVQRTDGTCAEGLFAVEIPDTVDPLPPYDGSSTTGTGAPYVACVPCVPLGVGSYRACSSFEACADDFGVPAVVDEIDVSRLAIAARLMAYGDASLVVGIEQDASGKWVWTQDQTTMTESLWASGRPPESAGCIVISSDGLRGTDECGGPVICTPKERPPCDGGG
ncbi:MAG: hypothetical protein VX589_09390 [Myxococcota bacterium]|nr:hypothetical protein [Myxococcota bacterium]